MFVIKLNTNPITKANTTSDNGLPATTISSKTNIKELNINEFLNHVFILLVMG